MPTLDYSLLAAAEHLGTHPAVQAYRQATHGARRLACIIADYGHVQADEFGCGSEREMQQRLDHQRICEKTLRDLVAQRT